MRQGTELQPALPGGQLIACGTVQAVALQGIQDEYYPSVAHDRRALKFLTFLQSTSQRL